ncbi:hypothetical protein SAMN05216214_11029 [Atopomonas hussainii]|uniref:Sel1 repeat protein n=1 Tax=Atopomonas hussainii TaxID=1429083 RepID=A0A1H7NV78_9GAMM|nr:hypothetical protein [Atopomonas hussainii]SEL27433.1 hypothetical protein SAMN05216214_11029 [Atopomonas hussainii]
MPTHFKSHSIFSIGALLLCTLSGQASETQSETTCGTGDFRAFFQQFASDSALQQASIATPLTLQTLSKDPLPKIKLEKLDETQRLSALIPTLEQWTELGLTLEWLPPSAAVLRGQRGEYMRTFVFKRRSCWMLSRVEDWTLGGSQTITTSRNDAAHCLSRGKAYEHVANVEITPSTQQLFIAALDSYLCAAADGSAEASYSAASLSLSGQAPRLENKQIEELYTAAAKQLPEAGLPLSDFYCDEGNYSSERPCANPDKAAQALIASAAMGSAEALNQLGYAYEAGTLVEQNIHHALACYNTAAAMGHERAAKNIKRLIGKGIEPTKQVKCIEAGR